MRAFFFPFFILCTCFDFGFVLICCFLVFCFAFGEMARDMNEREAGWVGRTWKEFGGTKDNDKI